MLKEEEIRPSKESFKANQLRIIDIKKYFLDKNGNIISKLSCLRRQKCY